MKKYLVILVIFTTALCGADTLETLLPDQAVVSLYYKGSSSKDIDLQKALDAPQLKQASAMFGDICNALLRKMPPTIPDTKLKLEDCLSLVSYDVAIGIIPPKNGPKPQIVAVFSDAKAAEDLKKIIAATIPIPATKVTVAGVAGEKYSLSPMDNYYIFAHKGKCFVVSNEDTFTAMLDNKSNLTQTDSFKKLATMTKGTGKVFFSMYLNLGFAMQMAPPPVMEQISAMGFQNSKGFMLRLWQGIQSHANSALLAPGEKSGLLKMLALSGGNAAKAISKVPLETSQVSYSYINMDNIFSDIMALMKKMDPREHKRAQKDIKDFEKKYSLDIRREILQVFSGDFVAFRPTLGSKLDGTLFWQIGLSNKSQFEKSLQRFLKLGYLEQKQIKYKNKTIYYLVPPVKDIRRLFNEETRNRYEPAPASVVSYILNIYLGVDLCFVIEEDHLLFSNLVQNLKEYIDIPADAKKPKAPKVAADAGMFIWEEGASAGIYRYNTIVSVLTFFESIIREAGLPFDAAKLPRPGDIRSLLGTTEFQWLATDQGLQINSHHSIGAFFSPAIFTGVAVAGIVAAIAIPGLIRARLSANEGSAIGSLRTISTSQAQFQQQALIDQDQDGVGEYGFIGELAGNAVMRGSDKKNDIPFLYGYPKANAKGVIVKSGYCYLMYLPTEKGFTSEASPKTDAKGADLRETRFVVYAWPLKYGTTGRRAFAVNQDGEVYQCYNDLGEYAGAANPPVGNAALDKDDSENKKLGGKLSNNSVDGKSWSPLY